MKTNKIKVTVYMDADLWKLAKAVYGNKRSQRLEQLLRCDLMAGDNLERLNCEIAETEKELEMKKQKRLEIIAMEKQNQNNADILEEAIATVERAVESEGALSEFSLSAIANRYKINKEELRKEIEKHGFKTV